MLKTICDILGCTRRRRQHKELTIESEELRLLQEKQKKYQARIADEEDWFRRVCVEHREVINDGHIPAPVSVHSSV